MSDKFFNLVCKNKVSEKVPIFNRKFSLWAQSENEYLIYMGNLYGISQHDWIKYNKFIYSNRPWRARGRRGECPRTQRIKNIRKYIENNDFIELKKYVEKYVLPFENDRYYKDKINKYEYGIPYDFFIHLLNCGIYYGEPLVRPPSPRPGKRRITSKEIRLNYYLSLLAYCCYKENFEMALYCIDNLKLRIVNTKKERELLLKLKKQLEIEEKYCDLIIEKYFGHYIPIKPFLKYNFYWGE